MEQTNRAHAGRHNDDDVKVTLFMVVTPCDASENSSVPQAVCGQQGSELVSMSIERAARRTSRSTVRAYFESRPGRRHETLESRESGFSCARFVLAHDGLCHTRRVGQLGLCHSCALSRRSQECGGAIVHAHQYSGSSIRLAARG